MTFSIFCFCFTLMIVINFAFCDLLLLWHFWFSKYDQRKKNRRSNSFPLKTTSEYISLTKLLMRNICKEFLRRNLTECDSTQTAMDQTDARFCCAKKGTERNKFQTQWEFQKQCQSRNKVFRDEALEAWTILLRMVFDEKLRTLSVTVLSALWHHENS